MLLDLYIIKHISTFISNPYLMNPVNPDKPRIFKQSLKYMYVCVVRIRVRLLIPHWEVGICFNVHIDSIRIKTIINKYWESDAIYEFINELMNQY